MRIDWGGVAERISALVTASGQENVAGSALRLGVTEPQLREAMSGRSRFGSLKVVTAVIREFGLDPSWLVTGEYDATTHRAALEGDRHEIDSLVKRLVRDAHRPADRRADRVI